MELFVLDGNTCNDLTEQIELFVLDRNTCNDFNWANRIVCVRWQYL